MAELTREEKIKQLKIDIKRCQDNIKMCYQVERMDDIRKRSEYYIEIFQHELNRLESENND